MQSSAHSLPDCEDSDNWGWSEVIVHLHGGEHQLRLVPGRSARVPAMDGCRARWIQLDYLDRPTELAAATLTLLATVLSTYSVYFSYSINRIVRKAFKSGCFCLDRIIDLDGILCWTDSHPPYHWPSLKHYLRRLSENRTKPLVSEDVRQLLNYPEQFEERGNGAYLPLLTNDPERGALTEQEMDSICAGVNAAHAKGDIDIREYALAWLLMTTGIRPIQAARLKIGDVLIEGDEDGGKTVKMRIPLAKGQSQLKNGHVLRTAPRILADVLHRYMSKVGDGRPHDPLFASDTGGIDSLFRGAFRKMDIYSERVGGPVHVTPSRFRYTIATRAIAHGATDEEVALLLTHRRTNSIKYYRASMPELVDPIERELGGQMAGIANSFLGNVPQDGASASVSERHRLIRDFSRLKGERLGKCNSSIDCRLNAPAACLNCSRFVPFIDAPWQELVADARREVDRESDPHMRQLAVNHLNRLLAIANACAIERRGSGRKEQ